ncbi:MAG TPA: BON domain-containing protein [Tahibacter sp.]|uniref:BON domain-containing protein n=1 Tax=Tahibacter sp. TaxID=2056211 RepID=UPI002B64C68F|nr:BON domain-containing protein [Tahibacter sp.]HSX62098.1 BON domain-containing protein [Tahibacter sp.]
MKLSRPTPPFSLLAAATLALYGGFAASSPLAPPSSPCEAPRGDQSVAAAIESRLSASSRMQADDIVVIVVAGAAQLRGLVRSDRQKLLAEQMAGDTKGVVHLDNQLDVVDWAPVTDFARNEASRRDGAHRSRQTRSDTWITATVEKMLAMSLGTDNCEIVVQTRDGVVGLQGTMTSPEARHMAIDLVSGTSGVRSVDAAALLVAGNADAH